MIREVVLKTARAPRFVYDQVKHKGTEGICSSMATIGSEARIDIFGNPGQQVWRRDWDILVMLDACCVDLLEEMTKFDFIDEIETHYSIASRSSDWIRRTFSPEFRQEIDSTAYITGNPFTDKVDVVG